KGIVHGNQSGVFKSVENKIGNIIAVSPREIEIKIGWILSEHIDKTFKIEIEFHRIYIRYPKQISHNAIGATAPTNVEIIFTAGVFQNLPIDQKIGYESFLFNDGQFFFDTFENALSRIFIPVMDAVVGEFFKQSK